MNDRAAPDHVDGVLILLGTAGITLTFSAVDVGARRLADLGAALGLAAFASFALRSWWLRRGSDRPLYEEVGDEH